MSKHLSSFISNSLWLSMGKLGTTLAGVFLIPLYTASIGPVEFGIYELIQTSTLFLLPIITCQTGDAIQVFLLKKETNSSRVLTIAFFVFLTMWLISLVMFPFINRILEGFAALFYILLFLQGLQSLLHPYFKGLNKVKIASIISFLEATALVVLSFVFLKLLNWGLLGILWAIVISKLFCVVAFFIKIPLKTTLKVDHINIKYLKTVLIFSTPLIPNMMGWWTNNMSDRYILKTFLGIESTGIYGVAAIFPTLINIICTVLISSWIITAMQNNKKKDGRMFNIMSSLFSISITTIAMLMILALPLIFPIFIQSEDFLPAQNFVPILLISAVFSGVASLFGVTYLSQNDTFQAAITTVASGALNIVLNFILIPFMGIMGAVVSTHLSFSLLAFLRYLYVRKTTSLIVSPIALFVLIAYPPLFFMEMYGLISNRLLILFSILFVLGMCLKASLIIKQNNIIRQLIS